MINIKKYTLIMMLLVISTIFYGCKGVMIGPGTSDFAYDLSGNYRLTSLTGEAKIYKKDKVGDIGVIDKKIVEVAWDEDFIIAKQERGGINYWIIDVKKDKKHGPLNEIDFKNKTKELNINGKLKLEAPEKYKYLEEQQREQKSGL